MPSRLTSVLAHPKLRRRLVLVVLAAAAVWFAFFDSHSLTRRVEYATEARALAAENARLAAEIEKLEAQVAAGLSDEVVEEVAREQYGMRRPGETVYPVEKQAD